MTTPDIHGHQALQMRRHDHFNMLEQETSKTCRAVFPLLEHGWETLGSIDIMTKRNWTPLMDKKKITWVLGVIYC